MNNCGTGYSYPPTPTFAPPDAPLVARLTDQYGEMYDVLHVTVSDLAVLNVSAQNTTGGALWWEAIDPDGWEDLRHADDWSIAAQAAAFRDEATARRFAQAHPGWNVFVTLDFRLGADGALTRVSDEEWETGMGYT